MSSIDFFVPVTFKSQIKTIPEKALEVVDEYFYFGDKFRVSILPPDAEHPQSWAMHDRQDRYRSWINIAIKVASYCTVIIPLIALLTKAILRANFKVYSIQIENKILPGSQMEFYLPLEDIQRILSFMTYKEQARICPVAHFVNESVRSMHADRIAPLKAEIESLPPGPLAREELQRLLVELIKSPAIGHPKYWVPVMDTLLSHATYGDTVDTLIQYHTNLADLLATSVKQITANQIYQFCRYLGAHQLTKTQPWIGYRSLEQYRLRPQLDAPSINKALEEYLTQAAKTFVRAGQNGYLKSNGRVLKCYEIDIDPRRWFGFNGSNASLWHEPGLQNGAIAPMPDLLTEVLWSRIQSLREANKDRPLNVGMTGRAESQLPLNFTLPIAQRITNANIYLDHNNTVNNEDLDKPEYGRHLGNLTDAELVELAQQYPGSLQQRSE